MYNKRINWQAEIAKKAEEMPSKFHLPNNGSLAQDYNLNKQIHNK